MLFTSIEFYIFLTAVWLVWRVVPGEWRTLVLLGGSYVVYAWWQPWFLLVLVFCTGVAFWAGLMMTRTPDGKRRKRVLAGAAVLNLLPLLFFKYLNFFNASLGEVFLSAGWKYTPFELHILLPVGISFYTFQAIAYCVDVYNGRIEAESRGGVFALYMAFFPKLISGPIERGAALLPQLRQGGGGRNSGNFSGFRIGVRHDEEGRSDGDGAFFGALFESGVRLFLWGVFKKIVIADRLGMYVDMVFGDPQMMVGKTAIIGAWMFSLQIYCDFSAYMDMAIGCGRMFGFELSRNFNFPYMARSVREFWRRWHITLTSWFRDYVYIPLGGRRVATGRWVLNIMAVFLLSGLWHGAGWTFIFWGGLHGLFYLAGKFSEPWRDGLRNRLGVRGKVVAVWQGLFTFQLVTLAWVFFRAKTIGDAFGLIRNMGVHLDLPVRMLSSQFSTALAFGFALVFVGIELVTYWADRKGVDVLRAVPAAVRYPGYAMGLVVMALFGVSSNQFIYCQF